MPGTAVGLAILVLVALAPPDASARPWAWCPVVGGDIPAVIGRALVSFAPTYGSPGCTGRDCVAARDLECAARAQSFEGMPQGQIYIDDAAREEARVTREHVLQAFGQRHAGLVPLYCRILAGAAAGTDGDYRHDGGAIGTVTHLFLRIRRPPASCGPAVLAAFPRTEAVQQHLAAAGGTCLTGQVDCRGGGNQPRRKAKPSQAVRP